MVVESPEVLGRKGVGLTASVAGYVVKRPGATSVEANVVSAAASVAGYAAGVDEGKPGTASVAVYVVAPPDKRDGLFFEVSS